MTLFGIVTHNFEFAFDEKTVSPLLVLKDTNICAASVLLYFEKVSMDPASLFGGEDKTKAPATLESGETIMTVLAAAP